jgi:hypothetical protein
MDLDDLLDDVDMDTLKTKAVDKVAKKAPVKAAPAPEKVEEVKKELISKEIRPWLASSANVNKETREKWTKMAKIDGEAELTSKFLPSSAYAEWDTNANTKRGVNKSLQELVRTTLNSCAFGEPKSTKVATLVNPVTDSEHGKLICNAFTKQLVRDLRCDLTTDPNYDPTVFKNLAQVLANEKS